MAKTLYFLEKRNKKTSVLNGAAELRSKTKTILNQLSKLGYDTDTVDEISDILNRQHGHYSLLEETNENEVTILVEQITDWKPVFNISYDYSNLIEMEKWYRSKEANYQIVRKKGGKKVVLSWEEFIASVSALKWTKFGMPQKYNQAEDTIWDSVRHSIYEKI